MTNKRITWDAAKAESNVRKHAVTFDEAGSVLDDKLAMWSLDLEHGELRMNVIGYSKEGRVLFVVTVEIDEDEFRIISARKATRHERRRYENS